MILRIALFPFRVVFAVGCVLVILAAAPVLLLLGDDQREDEAP